MTGKELLEALSFVDERFIAEAETARLGVRIPWVKILSAAACLCILIAGVFALDNIGYKSAETEAAAPPAAIPEAAPEAAPEKAPALEEAEAEAEPIPPYPAEDPIPAGELHHIPYARLRVIHVEDDGSVTAIVEETDADTNLFEEEMQVTVIVAATKVPGANAEVQNDLRILHTDAKIEITDGAYDAGLNVLYVARVNYLCRDE